MHVLLFEPNLKEKIMLCKAMDDFRNTVVFDLRDIIRQQKKSASTITGSDQKEVEEYRKSMLDVVFGLELAVRRINSIYDNFVITGKLTDTSNLPR